METNRTETDKSLRIERDDADRALREMRNAEVLADKVIVQARQQADAVLTTARDRADTGARHPAPAEQAVVEHERRRADEVLEGERATADERLQRRRGDYSRALAALLPLEREHTDRDLLTERFRSDEAVAHRDDFLGIVSHDLRNLLGGIVIATSLLADDASKSDEGDQIVLTGKRIKLFAARMNRLIGDLVDVASLDAGRLASQIVPSDPNALIAETVELFRRAAEEKGVTLTSEIEATLPRAAFDHERMLQVLANLVTNAIKFSSAGGKVCVRGKRDGDYVHFSISDCGVGISEDMFDAVFMRFWQAGLKDRRGAGLGLYISKSIVEAHQGRIWIDSKLGEGSTFHFTIPVASAL